ncbi:MAG TPA: DUF167 domain-containing protein [Sedimentisphaerales bacterium]|nr:DUF167 domain-containing protein [Sedimentisphaerales bacterium]HRS11087.1 DUF167 domain-containing protein [Sedimentisphaerales bacterium]HRV47705.1 DUF167 domain-containing protein [Sedimentisphaerales bacterium]
MPQPEIQEDEEGVVLVAKIVPGSSKTALAGLLDRMVKVKVAAPPERGKANDCLIAFLAKQLGVRKNAVRIVAGQTNPVKHVRVDGISAQTCREKLGLG